MDYKLSQVLINNSFFEMHIKNIGMQIMYINNIMVQGMCMCHIGMESMSCCAMQKYKDIS